MPGRPVALRANLIAASTVSAPEFAKKNFVEIRHVFEQPLRQYAGQGGDVELHQIRQIAVEHALQRRAQRRVIATDCKDAEPAQKVQIADAIAIEEILTLALLETYIIADGFEHAHHLLVEMARMHGTALRLALHKHLGNV